MARASRRIEGGSVAALDDEIRGEERVRELEQACARLQRQLAQAKAKTADLVDAVYQAAHDAAIVNGRPAPVKPPAAQKKKADAEVALVALTDWQLGKATSEYDTEVCVDRVRHVVDRVRRITRVQRADHPVRECVILLGGDMVEGGGGIFPGQAHEVDSTGFEQMMRAANLISEVVLSMLAEFDTVQVYAVPGNHGRLGRKGDESRDTNLDNIAYAISRDQLKDQPRLTFHEHGHWYQHIQIGNYQALLVHGDQIRGFSGTPAFAIARKVTAWSSGALPVTFHDCYLGHYHQNLVITLPNGGQVRMTPSTESGSQYASEFMASRGRPGQRLVFVHPERGTTTGEYMIWL